ncbi:MAG TPA: HAD-IIB family hydrolase [Bryobacteraceae bacterium]|nr:HAD-IIB family hydrolase [Bryobacteraceae bacterium]
MRYLALASDYDGTLAHDGVVDQQISAALKRFRQSGRKLILVTGRELPDLESVFPELHLFDFVVAENGAVLFKPSTREKHLLAERPPDRFIDDLKQRGVEGLSVGDVIVATWHPHETAVLNSIRQLGLDLHVIFNKEAVMVLPSGVNKMTGLTRALSELKLSRHNLVGVGDAENDLAFLSCCECSVGVANSIPALKEKADWVTAQPRGAGVQELIERLLADDLQSLSLKSRSHQLPLGHADGAEISLNACGSNLLLCGQSGGGKSTFVAGFVERLLERGYQTCLIDPEGDYENLAGFFTVGDENRAPSFEQIFQLLDGPESNLVINLIGVKLPDRPPFFASLLSKLQEKALFQGRPHWLIIDEAHHLLPPEWGPASSEIAGQATSLMLVTVHPEHVSPAALHLVNAVAIVGKEPAAILREFAGKRDVEPPQISSDDLPAGEAAVWFLDSNRLVPHMQTIPGSAERKRHRRKYAEGELAEELAFWFRGPEGKQHLATRNLNTFLLLARGIDDETWLYHLRRADYSNWFANVIGDEELAGEAGAIEQDRSLNSAESRNRIAKAIEARYTAPA